MFKKGLLQILSLLIVILAWGLIMASDRPVLKKTDLSRLGIIPKEASIILAAPWGGEKTSPGRPMNELFVTDEQGGHKTRITFNGKSYNHFAVAPGRKMVAAIRFDEGLDGQSPSDFRKKKTLWVIDLENKKEWPLYPEMDSGWGGVDWSPDGQWIFLSIFKDQASDIYRLHPDGTELTNITKGIELKLGAKRPGKWVSDTGVSHDGQAIIFLYAPWEGPRPADFRKKNIIVTCGVDGSNPKVLTDGGDLPEGQYGVWSAGDYDPEFSYDGKFFTFQRATNKAMSWGVTSHDIYLASTDGKVLRRLSPENNTAIHGISDWSEDGRIIFTEWNKEDMFLGPVMVNADGSGYHRLEQARDGTHARWIPR
jgi:Tol biopolymer transport system component